MGKLNDSLLPNKKAFEPKKKITKTNNYNISVFGSNKKELFKENSYSSTSNMNMKSPSSGKIIHQVVSKRINMEKIKSSMGLVAKNSGFLSDLSFSIKKKLSETLPYLFQNCIKEKNQQQVIEDHNNFIAYDCKNYETFLLFDQNYEDSSMMIEFLDKSFEESSNLGNESFFWSLDATFGAQDQNNLTFMNENLFENEEIEEQDFNQLFFAKEDDLCHIQNDFEFPNFLFQEM